MNSFLFHIGYLFSVYLCTLYDSFPLGHAGEGQHGTAAGALRLQPRGEETAAEGKCATRSCRHHRQLLEICHLAYFVFKFFFVVFNTVLDFWCALLQLAHTYVF